MNKKKEEVKVFVIDAEGKPCLPTKPRRARQLLDQGKATVKQVVPFTIQLKRVIDNPVGSFEIAVDDGAKFVGIAVKNTKTDEIVFRGQLNHRQDVSFHVGYRRTFRQARRRRLRSRKPRYSNRIKSRIPPTIRQKKEAIIRVIKDLKQKLNIVTATVEEVCFRFIKASYSKFFNLTSIGKKYLRQEIESLGLSYYKTEGYTTKESRLNLGLSKRHSNDACAILKSNKLFGPEYFIKPRRTKPSKMRRRSEKNGFRHYDLVKANHKRLGIVVGSIAGLSRDRIVLRTHFSDHIGVSYKKAKLLQRFRGLIYSF